jgi:hypothetical protein
MLHRTRSAEGVVLLRHPLSLKRGGDVLVEQKTLTVTRGFLNQIGSAKKGDTMLLRMLIALSTHLLSLDKGISRLIEERRLTALVTAMTAIVNHEGRPEGRDLVVLSTTATILIALLQKHSELTGITVTLSLIKGRLKGSASVLLGGFFWRQMNGHHRM